MRQLTLLSYLFAIAILASCSGLKEPSALERQMSEYEDAVRIKPELTEKYFQKSTGEIGRAHV